MSDLQSRAGQLRRVATRRRLCGLVLIAVIGVAGAIVTSWSSATPAQLSENSHETAYPAGLGQRLQTVVPVSAAIPRASSHCIATTTPVGTQRNAVAALVTQTAIVRRAPSTRSAVVARLGRQDINGLPEVVGVIAAHSNAQCRPDWYRVQLSVVPNGTTGWVRTWAVRAYRVRSRIVVDLSEHILRLYRSGRLELSTPVAVGASATPTPTGRFFVNERYTLADARGPFGPAALGISGHSEVLQQVWVEDGPIGIHGTNEPWSIGHAASHGCIRVANNMMLRLFRLAPAGTPILVRA
jgi:lipoprotein-anchoring transpeptidase ErfK/SrfK